MSTPVDPLVTSLLVAASELNDHADPSRLSLATRLSAVLAAVRAVIRGYFDEGDDEAPGLVELRDALAAADAAIAPEKS